jgi:uncharacterized protein YfdQ (DUF2303 family)
MIEHNLFTAQQQYRLRAASDRGHESVDAVVKALRQESPEKFHTAESLKARVFFNQPRPSEYPKTKNSYVEPPYASFVHLFPRVSQ